MFAKMIVISTLNWLTQIPANTFNTQLNYREQL
jgi:hypothetical protein